MEKPWLAPESNVVELDTSYFSAANRKVALVLFLAIVGSLFFLLFAAYHMRLAASTDWVSTPEPLLLWFNTVVLFSVSAVFEWSRADLEKSRNSQARKHLYLAGFLTLVFLALQLTAWKQLLDLGYGVRSNPSNAFFYMITAIHGVHLIGGLIAWVRTLHKFNTENSPSQLKLSVNLCAVYWHFLLFVWVAMLALFVSS